MQKNRISINQIKNKQIMNKKVMKAAFVAAIAMVSGINVFNAQESEALSDIALANVEALAQNESGDFNCWWDSVDYKICYKGGDHLGCPCGSHEW
mgnify:CR=1 FL=1